jgi:DNA excision repair protein ERCC-6
MLNVSKETHVEDEVERHNYGYKDKKASSSSAKRIVNRVVKEGHVLVTTYAGLQTYGDILIPVQWGYAVLDEGHKIRNPNTSITIYCKELQTPNRIILSGTPMQNNLIELWSLFDFVYPMRLGTLVNFRNQFEQPIKIGGYANATNLQILTATKCAETLKEAISPYLLQRLKADVAADLPKKSEQVVFCKLTKPQRDAYEAFLASDEMTSILQRTRQSLYGIDILRKICNHPDLLDPRLRKKPGYKWGNPNKSGKMHVVKALLEIWKKAGDKILLFSQGVQMLDIIEHFVKSLDGFNYLRMDGGTNIKDRQSMVDRFNNDPDLHVFLLTTKVGGLGVNLTGANRVIIFDPDWNPSTDVQARERAWRLGQKKEVTIFRLMTAGTIEEKIYHRQIFKQMLADKVMKDPKQQQRFVLKDLYDLFTLGTPDEETTETGELFKGSEVKFRKDLPDRSHRHDFAPSSQIKVPDNDNNAYGGGPAPRPIAEPVSKVTATALPTLAAPATLAKAPEADYRSIEGVSKLEEFYDESEEMPKDEESRIMEGIFARSGVHSVLQHDQIVNGKRVVQADRGMIEREAKRIAAEAAAELKRAGEAARHVPIGTVTWTGEHGEGGRPQVRRRGAPASGAVLGNLAARQGMTGFTSNSQSPGGSRGRTPADSRPARGEDFIKLIPEYIKLQGGSVPSQMLVVHFGGMCKTPQDSALFKAVLEQVAELKKGGARLRGRWELKEEFK